MGSARAESADRLHLPRMVQHVALPVYYIVSPVVIGIVQTLHVVGRSEAQRVIVAYHMGVCGLEQRVAIGAAAISADCIRARA